MVKGALDGSFKTFTIALIQYVNLPFENRLFIILNHNVIHIMHIIYDVLVITFLVNVFLTERGWSYLQYSEDKGKPSHEDCLQVCKHIPGFCLKPKNVLFGRNANGSDLALFMFV